MQALEVQILEFGQIPKQLFTTPHAVKILKVRSSLHTRGESFPPIEISLVTKYDGFKDDITSLCYLNNILIITAKDGTMKCYDVETHRQIW